VVARIAEAYQRWRPRKIVVENNAFQQAVLDLLRRDDPKLPLLGYRTGAEKADDQIGLPALAAAVDRGDWIIPAGGAPHGGGCACAYCAWQRELLLYPAGEHSDTVMGMWFAEIAAREAARNQAYCWPQPHHLKTMRSPLAEFMEGRRAGGQWQGVRSRLRELL
jgi:hypothetical protein